MKVIRLAQTIIEMDAYENYLETAEQSGFFTPTPTPTAPMLCELAGRIATSDWQSIRDRGEHHQLMMDLIDQHPAVLAHSSVSYVAVGIAPAAATELAGYRGLRCTASKPTSEPTVALLTASLRGWRKALERTAEHEEVKKVLAEIRRDLAYEVDAPGFDNLHYLALRAEAEEGATN